ncbi:MAG TPA: class I SAM-dependent methyltransferase [Vicinamibacterales bacterium]|nr:class I SAM-dependent methyltransferase [Vicinamibacterales bacterium]
MSAGGVPDSGAVHPEAAGGIAFNGEVGRGVADVVLRIIAGQSGVRTICDLGCGNGYLAGQLGRRGFSVVGIDASDTYLQIARQHNNTGQVTYIKGLADRDLPQQVLFGRQPFDLVVSSDVIEHVYNPLEFLETALALLRPGGTAVIGTPYHGYLKNVAISVTGRWDSHHTVHWHGGHIKFFSVPSLRSMMRQAGFSEPHFEYYGRFPGFWKNMIAVTRKPA